ncbi:PucR family transcriptional regulator [Kribbella sp. NPDC050124]|uniref:PucR family transcriptional regulator n=1 Tax=Kribbella sp. NPDC050124 TaxID=3364114 RepID=UPI0037A5F772
MRWLLDRAEFDLRLRTGSATEEPLSWAHATDVLDPTPWLNGGELVLTTGLQLPRAAREQRAYVHRLTGAGVAGLGFGLGVRFDAIPAAVVDACEARALPLLEVPIGTAFIALTQAVAQQLADTELASLQRVHTIQRDITRVTVRSGLPGAVALLARELRGDAVVMDEYGVVMASSTTNSRLLERVGKEYRRLSRASRPGTVAVDTEDGILELQMIQGRSGVCGWLAVQHHTLPSPTDRMLLNQAAGLITLQLDWPAELLEAYHDLGGALLSLLLDAGVRSTGLERHLHHFGFEPRDEVVLVLAATDSRRTQLEQVVAAHLEPTKRPHVVASTNGGVAILLLARDAKLLVPGLAEAVTAAEVVRVVYGVSHRLDQAAIASGLGPAQLAAGAALREGRPVAWFSEVNLGPVLADEAVRTRVHSVAGPALAALGAADGPRDAGLLATLEAFLHHNGTWESAARSLGVHRHTLKARIARVEELTGLSLDVAENRALLLLALMSGPLMR